MDESNTAVEDGEQQYTSLNEVPSKLTEDFNAKFGKMEIAIQVLTAAVSTSSKASQPKKRPFVPVYDEHQTLSNSPKISSDDITMQQSVNIIDSQPGSSCQPAPNQLRAAMDAYPNQVSQPQDESPAIFVPPVNNNNNIATWVTDRAQTLGPFVAGMHLPLSNKDFRPKDDIEAQVSQLLATTAHHLTSGKQSMTNFPFKYIRRGHDMKRPTVNSLNLQEHLLGITHMIRDDSVPQRIKPYLYLHLEDVLEDSCDYEWHSGVRPWSEECFVIIPEGLVLSVCSTKTLSGCEPFFIQIMPAQDQTLCPIRAWNDYLNSTKPCPIGPAFILDSGLPLTTKPVVGIMRLALKEAGYLAFNSVSMHSLRRGGARTAAFTTSHHESWNMAFQIWSQTLCRPRSVHCGSDSCLCLWKINILRDGEIRYFQSLRDNLVVNNSLTIFIYFIPTNSNQKI